MHTDSNHSFVICAYEESPFLEKCIQSILGQTLRSKVILITSTPNQYISQIAKNYKIEYVINHSESGMVQDWNFGLSQANTKYVTLAHQDDVYSKNYTLEIIKDLERAKHPLIAFTDYQEIRNDNITKTNTMLKIKRIMLLPLKLRVFHNSRLVRRVILSFGCPICCPSVTFVKENLPEQVFQVGYRSCEDWQAWEKLSKLKGEFIYCTKTIMYHRIHAESATTAIIGDNVRTIEDYDMFRKFWPKAIAKVLAKLYAKSEQSNDIGKEEKS